MKISTQAGYICIEIEDSDWKIKNAKLPGGAKSFIEGIKTSIGHVSKNRDGFEYDPQTKIWEITDTPYNRKTIESLKEWYIEDMNQANMFERWK